jgi:hypothetical protein
MTALADAPDSAKHSATAPGGADAMTAGRTKVLPPSHQDPKSSARPSKGYPFRLGSEPQLISPSTRGIRNRSSGLLIIGSHASSGGGGGTMTTSSFGTSPSFSSTLPEPGSSTFRQHRSMTGKTWSGSLEGTSRARTFALETPRTFRQKPDESLRDYIHRFSKQHTELPNVIDSDVIGVFLAAITFTGFLP